MLPNGMWVTLVDLSLQVWPATTAFHQNKLDAVIF